MRGGLEAAGRGVDVHTTCLCICVHSVFIVCSGRTQKQVIDYVKDSELKKLPFER